MQSISMFEEKRESLGVKVIPTKGGSRIAKDNFGLKDSLENIAGQRKSLGADKLLHDIKEQPRIRRKSIGARKASIGKKVQDHPCAGLRAPWHLDSLSNSFLSIRGKHAY